VTVDASSYGRLVEGGSGGNYATGALVGEHGPEISWAGGGCVMPVGALASTPARSITIASNPGASDRIAQALLRAMQDGEIRLWPDDGTAGVPARI